MSSSILIAFVLLAAGVSATKRGAHDELITPRPYNNRYSDASGARDERSRLS
jgi:hypothetical protein